MSRPLARLYHLLFLHFLRTFPPALIQCLVWGRHTGTMHGDLIVTRVCWSTLCALSRQQPWGKKNNNKKTNPEARETLSPPGGLLAEQADRCRMNKILSHCSLMLHYSVLACLFVSVNFSFNVSGSLDVVKMLTFCGWHAETSLSLSKMSVMPTLIGCSFCFLAFLCFTVIIYLM